MTKSEAHKFVAKWRRILAPLNTESETAVLQSMERSCIGMALGGLVIVLILATRISLSLLWQAFALLGLLQSGFSGSMVLRFREARRALSLVPVSNNNS